MRPQGNIYKAGYAVPGTIKVSLSQFEKIAYKLIRLTGAIFASFSLSVLIYFYGPAVLRISHLSIQETQTKIEDVSMKKDTNDVATVAMIQEDEVPIQKKENVVYSSIDQFSISIPKISANSEVIYNVDPFNETNYLAALKQGVAHAQNTGLPGQGKRIYLFAHSTNSPLNFARFNAIFYQLRELDKGDMIYLTINNKEHEYRVREKLVVDSSDTHWITRSSDSEELVLQTCDPPGTTLKRLLIFAEPV